MWLSYYYAAHALHWPVNNPTWRRCTSAITRSHSLHEFELTENSRVTGAGIRAVCRRIKVCWWHADEGSIAQAVPLICMQPPSTVSPASPSAMYQGLSHVVLSACTRLHSKTLSGLAKQPLQLLDLSDATSITDVGLSALCDMAGTARKVAMNSYRITSDRLPLFMLTQMALSRRWHCHTGCCLPSAPEVRPASPPPPQPFLGSPLPGVPCPRIQSLVDIRLSGCTAITDAGVAALATCLLLERVDLAGCRA